MSKIDRMRRKHEIDLEIMQLRGEQQRERQKLKNEISLEDSNFQESQLGIVDKIRVMKTKITKDINLIKAGKWLLLWGTIDTLISTCLTIAGLISFFSSSLLTLLSFIFVILITQFTVFLLSKHISTIKKEFTQHYVKSQLLRFSLLVVSIYGNYTFFTVNRELSVLERLVTLCLCICIDLIAVFCVSIGNDFKNLSKQTDTRNIITVVENLYKFVQDKNIKKRLAIKAPLENKNSSEFVLSVDTKNKKLINEPLSKNNVCEFVQDKNTEKESVKKEHAKTNNVSMFVQDKDTTLVKNAIISYKDGNVCPSISAIADITGLTKNTIVAAKKLLENKGIIKTDGKTTYVLEMEGVSHG